MRLPFLATTALASTMLFLVPGAAQAFDWDGKYVGGVVGVIKSTGTFDWDLYNDFFTTHDSGTFEFSGLGVMAGVTSGINFHLDDKFVVGIEGDASLVWLRNSGSIDGDEYYGEFEEELNALLTLRGRAGVLSDDEETYFYVTGGLAAGDVNASAYLSSDGVFDDPEAVTVSGWVFGLIGGIGVEHAIKEDMTVKAEILGYALGSLDGSGFAGKGDSFGTYHPAGIILRTGINFHF
jgi:opacity protein-like surface antigen